MKQLILGEGGLRLLSKKRISVEKTIREKEIVKVTQVRMSMACFYLLGKCDCSCGRQFPKFQFDLQRKQSSLSLLIDMFGKVRVSWHYGIFEPTKIKCFSLIFYEIHDDSVLKCKKPWIFMVKFRSSHRRCSVRKGVLRNFAKFTGKHLCQSFLFNKVAGLSLKNTSDGCF